MTRTLPKAAQLVNGRARPRHCLPSARAAGRAGAAARAGQTARQRKPRRCPVVGSYLYHPFLSLSPSPFCLNHAALNSLLVRGLLWEGGQDEKGLRWKGGQWWSSPSAFLFEASLSVTYKLGLCPSPPLTVTLHYWPTYVESMIVMNSWLSQDNFMINQVCEETN